MQGTLGASLGFLNLRSKSAVFFWLRNSLGGDLLVPVKVIAVRSRLLRHWDDGTNNGMK